jgi:hypothetical protein
VVEKSDENAVCMDGIRMAYVKAIALRDAGLQAGCNGIAGPLPIRKGFHR